MNNTEMQKETCKRCRKGTVSPVTVDAVHTHDGETVSFKETFMRCDNCEREYFTEEQSDARQMAVTNAIRTRRGLLTTGEIEYARNQYGLNQADFEKALGVGKNVVGRWERGTVPPTGAANFGLWVALHEPEVFARWAKTRGVEVSLPATPPAVAEARTMQVPTATPGVLLFGMPGKFSRNFSGTWPAVLESEGKFPPNGGLFS